MSTAERALLNQHFTERDPTSGDSNTTQEVRCPLISWTASTSCGSQALKQLKCIFFQCRLESCGLTRTMACPDLHGSHLMICTVRPLRKYVASQMSSSVRGDGKLRTYVRTRPFSKTMFGFAARGVAPERLRNVSKCSPPEQKPLEPKRLEPKWLRILITVF